MVGLRHIWTMSSYFCYDAKMEDLLQKISYVFTEKIKEIVQLNNIFSRTATEAYDLATNCERLLLAWKKTYMATRAFIENSSVGSRWEFDNAVLFSDVEHCARISQDIANVAQVMRRYKLYTNYTMEIFLMAFFRTDFHRVRKYIRTTFKDDSNRSRRH